MNRIARQVLLLVVALAMASSGCTRKKHSSRGGIGTPGTTAPVVTIADPTTAGSYTSGVNPLDLGGLAWDDVSVDLVTWSNAATGASGVATGTLSWSAVVPLSLGENEITVLAQDGDGNVGADSIRVTRIPAGTIQAWGYNSFGNLGDGTPANRYVPVTVIDPGDPTGILTGVEELSLGLYDTLALMGDGTVRAWGQAIGDGTTGYSMVPAKVLDPGDPSGFLNDVSAIDTGWGHDLVARADGTVRAWGGMLNDFGQIGDGTNQWRLSPTAVIDPGDPTGLLTGVIDVKVGQFHSVALCGDGSVRTWGSNDSGQLGDGNQGASISSNVPVVVIDPTAPSGFLSRVTAVAASAGSTMALLDDGTLRAWGSNAAGQLGDGTTTDSPAPIPVTDPSDPSGYLTGVTALAAGTSSVIALLGDGTLRTWGSNSSGQLGDGTDLASPFPVPVADPDDPTGRLTRVVAVAAGEEHMAALLEDGTVRTWGENGWGQLGEGTELDQWLPVRVVDAPHPEGYLAGARAISAGGDSTGILR